MPKSIFDGFVILGSFQIDGPLVELRLVPESFDEMQARGVRSVRIASCSEPDRASRKIAAIQQGSITDICADSELFEVWLMNEEKPVSFQGGVTWSDENVGVSDYIRVVEDYDRVVGQVRQLRGTIVRVTGFIERAIDRAERKEAAARPGDDRYTKEVRLLRSVRRQFSDD